MHLPSTCLGLCAEMGILCLSEKDLVLFLRSQQQPKTCNKSTLVAVDNSLTFSL